MRKMCAAPGCQNHVKRNRDTYCCIRCARPKPAPRFCECGALMRDYRAQRCGPCAMKAGRRYGDDVVERIRAMRSVGVELRQICAQIGMKFSTVRDLVVKHQLAKGKATQVVKPALPKAPRPPRPIIVRIAKPKHRQPILIPLREVYRYGAELELPLRRRGDVVAVSRAMRRIDAAHPGFRIEVHSGRRPLPAGAVL